MNVKTISAMLVFITLTGLSQDYKKYFDEYGVKGSFIIHDMNNDKYFMYDSARCYTRFTPASTFKVANTIIGLETGVIADENFIIKWDSTKSREACDHDLTLRDAIKNSCVWYYKELARRVGMEKMQEMVNKLGYGNMDLSSGVDKFWLEGSLKISQAEQVEFLKKLYKYELPVERRSIDILKNIIVLDSNSSYVMRGKTGWGVQNNIDIGWLVGWVEKAGNVYFYAVNIESDKEVPKFGEARMKITEKILKDMGVL